MRSFIKALKLHFLFKINSLIWKFLLRLNGIKVGKNFYIEGGISLKLRGLRNLSYVEFGNDVNIFGSIDLRTREEGCILISDSVVIDNDVRIVAARSGKVIINRGCKISKGCIFSAGANIDVGENTLIGPYCMIQASNHGTNQEGAIKGQPYSHFPISIEKGSWLAANVVVLAGIIVREGSVIGASSVLTKDTLKNSVNMGNPSRNIGNRLAT